MSVDTVEMVTLGLPHHAGTRGDRFFACRVQGLFGLCPQACGTLLSFAQRVWVSQGKCTDNHLSGPAALEVVRVQGWGVAASSL